ncbi:MAG: prolipoprotein diacylglyceryl transferase family protein [Thermoguttaceae bacterium]
MAPELRFFWLTVPAYPVMIGLGMVAAGLVRWLLPVRRVPRAQSGFVVFPASVGLIAGAKLPVLVSYGLRPEFAATGKSVLGALVGAYLAVRLAKWWTGQSWKGGGDAFVLPLAAGLAVGRVGCLLNGCCWGTGGFPAPLLEIAFHAAAFAVVCVLRRRRVAEGAWFPLYLGAYCCFRFFAEFIRIEPRVLAGLTVYQWIAAAGVAVFCYEVWIRLHRPGEPAYEQSV